MCATPWHRCATALPPPSRWLQTDQTTDRQDIGSVLYICTLQLRYHRAAITDSIKPKFFGWFIRCVCVCVNIFNLLIFVSLPPLTIYKYLYTIIHVVKRVQYTLHTFKFILYLIFHVIMRTQNSFGYLNEQMTLVRSIITFHSIASLI